jgi:hypothetical protein
VKLYRAALHLYPRQFRRDYGDDMLALVEHQLRDESAVRVVGRTALDLLLTVPTRHLEARMHRSTTTPLVIIFVAVAAAFLVFGGPLGLIVGVALLALASVLWLRNRPVVAAQEARWWKFLLAGVGLLAALVVVTTSTGELPDGGWFVAMIAMFTSFALIGAGTVLGIARRFRSLPG